MFIRPVALSDHPSVLHLAEKAGIGMTSLPPDAEVLRKKIERAAASFAGHCASKADESYLFVLEDAEKNTVAGICGILCHVGLRQPFYSYKLSTITQSSESLGIFSRQEVLSIVNDYTGTAEIGSLYLLPEYRRDRLGRLLSRIRFLFMAEFRERFPEKVMAEIRGVHDRDGNSPFYDSLVRPFFQMEFKQADYICATKGNQFIADLMPKNPVYVSLLPKEAREVIGVPYASSEPAKALLEAEGFFYNHYLDIFDGGPTVEAYTDELRTLKESRTATVVEVEETVDAERFLICNRKLAAFRGIIGRVEVRAEGEVAISRRAANLLQLECGEELRYVGF